VLPPIINCNVSLQSTFVLRVKTKKYILISFYACLSCFKKKSKQNAILVFFLYKNIISIHLKKKTSKHIHCNNIFFNIFFPLIFLNLYFFYLLLMRLFLSHDPYHEFVEFTQVDSSCFFIFLIEFFLILSFNNDLIENHSGYF
jgi:hypothetical protein